MKSVVKATMVDHSQGTIVYAGGFELPDRNAAALRVRANARIFRSLGYRVVLLGTSRDRPSDGRLYPVDSAADVEAWETGYPRNSLEWLRQIVSPAVLSKLFDCAGIGRLTGLVCYNFPAVAQARMARLAHSRGGWAVADCTEWYARRRNDSLPNIVKNVDVPLRMRLINRRMDGMITTSPFITEFYGLEGFPITEIPTLMDRRDLPADLAPAPSERCGKVKKLIFAGSGFDAKTIRDSFDGPKERVDVMIELLWEATKHEASFSLDLFGLEESQYLSVRPDHHRLLNDLGGSLKFHGRQPRSTVLRHLIAADFSIFFREATRTNLAGFPGKFAESITFGTPVITNPMPNITKYAEEGSNSFLVDHTDGESAGAQLAAILRLAPGKIDAMKDHCAQSDTFLGESFVEPVRAWLEELSEGPERGRVEPSRPRP